MPAHTLQSRTDNEVLWWQRRDMIKAAATWVAMGGASAALAQQRSNVVQLTGRALLNGRSLLPGQSIQTGDEIRTGPGSLLVFTLGSTAFLVRQNTLMTVERGNTLNTVSVLRLLSGAVASVWGKGSYRTVVTPTLTAGIRGTGVYTEVRPLEDSRTYFCNCYGTVDLSVGSQKQLSQSDYHQSFWAEAGAAAGPVIRSAGYIDHTDEELEFLAGLIQERTYWQIAGRKGKGDGSGTMGY